MSLIYVCLAYHIEIKSKSDRLISTFQHSKDYLSCRSLHYLQCHQISLQLRHNVHDGVSNHQPHDCLLNRLFRRRSKETSKLYVTGICAGNSPVTGEFPAQRASIAENVFIWWRHHIMRLQVVCIIHFPHWHNPTPFLSDTLKLDIRH